AKEIDAYCSKDKMMLNHVIVAKVGEVIKKVKCLTCGSEHVYRPHPPKTRAGGKGGKASGQIRASDYELLIKGRDLAKAKKYKTNLPFVKNDVIDHSTFGIGVVVREKEGN